MATQKPSPAQQQRQRERNPNGRYADYHECQVPGCTKRVGEHYCSDRRTDTRDSANNLWGDCAIELCERCARHLDKLLDAEAFALMTGSTPAPWIRPRSTATSGRKPRSHAAHAAQAATLSDAERAALHEEYTRALDAKAYYQTSISNLTAQLPGLAPSDPRVPGIMTEYTRLHSLCQEAERAVATAWRKLNGLDRA